LKYIQLKQNVLPVNIPKKGNNKMSLNQTIRIKVAIVIIHLLFYHMIFAQTENQNNTIEQEPVRLKKYNLLDNSSIT